MRTAQIGPDLRLIPRGSIFLLFFQLFKWTSLGKSVDTTRNSALKLVAEIANFESVLLKTNEAPQNRQISQTLAWSVVVVGNFGELLNIFVRLR